MNISYRWLQTLAPSIADTPAELADRLGMLGAPADELVEIGAELGDIVIARVDEVRAHPNADRLRICEVDAGSGGALQVVCGAPNVEAGRYYPFAPVGARLPGGVQIRKAKLRGEVSEGMLCSPRELGLGRDHLGLMTLAGEWDPGARLLERLELDDARLVLDITPNRPDLLSHLGVAREVAPGGVDDIRLPPFSDEPAPEFEIRPVERDGEVEGVRVRIEDEAGCPRYLAAVVRGVRVGPSPEWLATRLRAVGLRPINNVVDATNYVLMELGQPLHAFDLHRLEGGEIRVRRAAPGETLRTLDGVDRELDAGTLVIADARRPVAVAGVMGGEESEVTGDTTGVLIECALFDAGRVRRAARGLGFSTDASFRFERGVDPELQPRALRRVVELITMVAGGTAAPVALDVHPRPAPPRTIELRPARVEKLLGAGLGEEEIAGLLRRIGFDTTPEDGALRVTVPGHRPDVAREVDLIEEVARRRGYDSFADELAPFRPSSVPEDPRLAVQRRLHDRLAAWGLMEARTAAFAPEAAGRVPLLNPLSAEESHLRDRLTPGLLRRVEHNWAHGVRDVRLYEIGTVFLPAEPGGVPREEVRVAAVLTGARRPPHWTGNGGAWDVWDLKALRADVEAVVGGGGVVAAGRADPATEIDAPAWADPVWTLEVTLPAMPPARAPVVYQPLPEFPAVERDLALLVPQAVVAERVEEVIRGAAGELLECLWPFDLYEGKGVAEGVRSIAWRLRFRADRTLTDAEVDRAVQAVLSSLDEQLGVHRR